MPENITESGDSITESGRGISPIKAVLDAGECRDAFERERFRLMQVGASSHVILERPPLQDYQEWLDAFAGTLNGRLWLPATDCP